MFNYPLLNLLLYFNLIVNLKAFNLTSKNNLVAYWGQNSYGNSEEAHKDSHERPMSDYCKDQTYDTIVISFLIKFNAEIKNGHPVLNMGKHCSKKFPNSLHPYCPEVAAGIKYCQNQGKKVLLSMGGYAGDYTLKDDESAKNFAQRVWDLYLGGKTDHRPFGEVALDGIDLDIEKGPPESYAVFSNKLKEIIDGQKEENKKEYFITAAPQCPFPDQYLKNVLEHGWLDAVFVQFYNNECAIGKDGFNFATWDGWARFASKNKNVKIFLGAPGGPTAASSGYLNFQELEPIINEVKEKYPSFGGVMLWDISQADQN
ncbi:glycoside hydrolase, partial [Neoconidiobolus thromboides FSU 785]